MVYRPPPACGGEEPRQYHTHITLSLAHQTRASRRVDHTDTREDRLYLAISSITISHGSVCHSALPDSYSALARKLPCSQESMGKYIQSAAGPLPSRLLPSSGFPGRGRGDKIIIFIVRGRGWHPAPAPQTLHQHAHTEHHWRA